MIRRIAITLSIGMFTLCSCVLSGCSYNEKAIIEEQVPEYVFTYAENQPENYPTTEAAYKFSELVYEQTKGRIKIIVHSGGTLGDEVSVIEQLQFGGIDFARASIMSMGELNPKLNILQLPYLYKDSDHMWMVLDGDIGFEFMESLESCGLDALSWYDAGARHFYTTEKVSCLEDLTGKKIRVAESDLMKALVSALGGIPIPMAYSDVFSALETGEINGAENNWSSYTFTDHHKVAGYMLLDGHNRIPELQLASSVTWDKLSKSDQIIIKSCAIKSAKYERTLWKEQEELSRKKAENAGVIATELTEEEIQRFREAVMPLYAEFGEQYQELIQKIQEVNQRE